MACEKSPNRRHSWKGPWKPVLAKRMGRKGYDTSPSCTWCEVTYLDNERAAVRRREVARSDEVAELRKYVAALEEHVSELERDLWYSGKRPLGSTRRVKTFPEYIEAVYTQLGRT